MASEHQQITREKMLGGVDTTTRPHLLGEDEWVTAHNMVAVNSRFAQVPHKVVKQNLGAGPILSIITMPSGGAGGSVNVVLTDSGAFAYASSNNTGGGGSGGGGFPVDEDIVPPLYASTDDGYRKFFNGGGSLPAGNYRLSYVNGALQYAVIGDGKWYVCNALGFNGYFFAYGSSGAQVWPGNQNGFTSQALCEAANAGIHVDFTHTGGTIEVHMADYGSMANVAGSPAPTFRLHSFDYVPTFQPLIKQLLL